VTEDRLRGRIDGALHLLDRQLIDSEGRMLGKVDDVELEETDDGVVVSALLTGPAALLGRLGGRLDGRVSGFWGQLRVTEPHRTWPWRIDIAHVDRLDSAVHLRGRRDGIVSRDRDGLRLGWLTGMAVRGPGDRSAGRVLDARFEPFGEHRLVLRSLLVGHGRPGSLLGYDRRSDQGPWVVRTVVRRLHRSTVIVDAADADVDWTAGVVRLRTRPSERPRHPFDGGT
jgi:hypothetical protein